MLLSTLIVNHNGGHFLPDCLKSISRHVCVEHEVIIVDNASTDGSRDLIMRDFPGVHLIQSQTNLGFAGGNNLASSHAAGTYLLLLNPDTILLSDILPAISILRNNPGVGTVGSLMIGKNNLYRSSAGYFPKPFKLLKLTSIINTRGFFQNGRFPAEHAPIGYIVDWVEASFFLTRASLWRTAKGFDESYFMYGEEMDYCKRTLSMGFTTAFCPDTRYFHFGGYDPSRFPLIIHALIRYHKKHSDFVKRGVAVVILFSGLLVRCAYYGARFLAGKSGDSKDKFIASWRALLMLR